MKLKGSLFIVIAGPERQSPVQAVYRIRLNPDHTIYKAHFPELPITPGVILVRIGVELLGDLLGRKVRLVGAPNVKFTAPVYPEDGKVLDYEITLKEDSLATIIVKDGEIVYSKQTLRYE
ncbi:MAG: hypothetical protein J5771_01355 [Bacteroidales bacterium]|nr:hypothetical protein [Bacteroidales bacterium]